MTMKTLSVLGSIVIAILLIALAYGKGETAGHNAATAEYNEQIDANNAEVTKYKEELQTFKELSARTLEQQIASITTEYLNGVEDGKNQANSIISDLSNDNRRLSVNLKRAESATNQCDIRTDSASSSSNHATERAELSPADGAFFIAFANEADDVTRQLGACQALISTYSDQAKFFKAEIDAYRRAK